MAVPACPYDFDMQVEQGDESIDPEAKFNFDLLIPAGGSGSVAMFSLAHSQVALTPEPSSLAIGLLGIASLASISRRPPCRRAVVNS